MQHIRSVLHAAAQHPTIRREPALAPASALARLTVLPVLTLALSALTRSFSKRRAPAVAPTPAQVWPSAWQRAATNTFAMPSAVVVTTPLDHHLYSSEQLDFAMWVAAYMYRFGQSEGGDRRKLFLAEAPRGEQS